MRALLTIFGHMPSTTTLVLVPTTSSSPFPDFWRVRNLSESLVFLFHRSNSSDSVIVQKPDSCINEIDSDHNHCLSSSVSMTHIKTRDTDTSQEQPQSTFIAEVNVTEDQGQREPGGEHVKLTLTSRLLLSAELMGAEAGTSFEHLYTVPVSIVCGVGDCWALYL